MWKATWTVHPYRWSFPYWLNRRPAQKFSFNGWQLQLQTPVTLSSQSVLMPATAPCLGVFSQRSILPGDQNCWWTSRIPKGATNRWGKLKNKGIKYLTATREETITKTGYVCCHLQTVLRAWCFFPFMFGIMFPLCSACAGEVKTGFSKIKHGRSVKQRMPAIAAAGYASCPRCRPWW